MKHLISGLMSWMKSDTAPTQVLGRTDLETWAKTEYKDDWQYAYHFMLNNPGKAPSLLSKPNYKKSTVKGVS